MQPWAQLTSLGISAIGFLLVALPRAEEADSSAAPAFVQWPAARLLRFPVFWAGLLLLCYVAVQGLNPAWRFVSNSSSWWLEPVPHVPWLPSGVRGPFGRSNPWRVLTVFGSVWLLVCSVWAGFLRRQSYRSFFTLIVANAFLVAVLGVLEQLIATKRIYWTYLPSNGNFVASFIYRNHAGPYFNLIVSLATGLAWWHFQRERRHLESPGRSVAFVFLGALVGVMVLFSYSRMSIVMLLAFIAVVSAILTIRLLRHKGPGPDRAEYLPAAVALAALVGVSLSVLRTDKVWNRFAGAVADPAASIHDRALVRQASIEMLRDRWQLGWGAGSFRYGFPIYAQRYPEIYDSALGRRMYWEHAHDDLLEFPIELGLAGLIPVAAMLGYFAWQLVLQRFWRNGFSLCAVLGCVLVLVHAGLDFVFQNPAVLFTWAVMLAGAARWAELDQPLGRRAVVPAA